MYCIFVELTSFECKLRSKLRVGPETCLLCSVVTVSVSVSCLSPTAYGGSVYILYVLKMHRTAVDLPQSRIILAYFSDITHNDRCKERRGGLTTSVTRTISLL